MLRERGDPEPTRQRGTRRAFQPPKERRPRRRLAAVWPPSDWRAYVPPAFVRAVISIGFLVSPAFEGRFGSLAFSLTCGTLATVAGLGALAVARSEARQAWPSLATDAVACALLAPVIAVAGRVQVAAPELGGTTNGSIAIGTALLAAFVILMIVAAVTGSREDRSGGIELLMGALMVGGVMLGAERFATEELATGLSLAAMAAALSTALYGLFPPAFRSLIPPTAFLLVSISTAAIARGGEAGRVSDEKAGVALLITAIAGGALLVIPAVTARLGSDRGVGDEPRR